MESILQLAGGILVQRLQEPITSRLEVMERQEERSQRLPAGQKYHRYLVSYKICNQSMKKKFAIPSCIVSSTQVLFCKG